MGVVYTVCACVCVPTGMEGDGEVIISSEQNCSHCESGECHEIRDELVCQCDDELSLAPDGVSCLNVTGLARTLNMHTQICDNLENVPMANFPSDRLTEQLESQQQ